MTTAHRPQLEAALGKSNLAGQAASHHQRAGNLPQFYHLKKRVAKKIERDQLKRQLLQAEGKASGKPIDDDDDMDDGGSVGEKRKLESINNASGDDAAEGSTAAEPAAKKLKSVAAAEYISSSDSDSDEEEEPGADPAKDRAAASRSAESDEELDDEDRARKKWEETVKEKYKDEAGSGSSSDEDDSDSDSDSSSDDEQGGNKLNEDELLQRELAKIRAEREAQRRKEEEARAADEDERRTVDIARGNPLMNSVNDYTVKKKWYEDAVFKNQAKGHQDGKKKQNEFINDLLRSDFNKRFMKRYIK